MRSLFFALAGVAASSTAQSLPLPAEVLSDRVVRSTTVEWSDAFRAAGLNYRPPRYIVMRPPRGHPAGGSGYGSNILVLDGRELDDILAVFGKDGATLAALVIAHEVAHHAQRQFAAAAASGATTGKAKELQADCAAGWWLARSNARALRVTGRAAYPLPDLDRALSQLLTTLAVLNGRINERGVPEDSIGHGTVRERTDAIMRGIGANGPALCGILVLPGTASSPPR